MTIISRVHFWYYCNSSVIWKGSLDGNCKQLKNAFHMIGLSDLVDLWVIKIKKPMIL